MAFPQRLSRATRPSQPTVGGANDQGADRRDHAAAELSGPREQPGKSVERPKPDRALLSKNTRFQGVLRSLVMGVRRATKAPEFQLAPPGFARGRELTRRPHEGVQIHISTTQPQARANYPGPHSRRSINWHI